MVVDIIFVIVLLLGFYTGFSRGIIQTVFTVISLIFGLMAAFKFAPATTQFLETTFNNDNPLMFIAGFLLSFAVVMIFIRMIARFLEGLLQTANINFINQIAGGILLGGISILLFSVLLWFGDQARMIDPQTKTDSYSYPYLKEYPAHLKDLTVRLKPVFYNFWEHSMDMMDKLEQISIEQTENTEVQDLSEELDQEKQ